jgi:hypothetical protein
MVFKKFPIVYGAGKIITNITTNSAYIINNQVIEAHTSPHTSFTHHTPDGIGHGHLQHGQQYFSSFDSSSSSSSSSLLLFSY